MIGKIICVFRPHKWLITANPNGYSKQFYCKRCGESFWAKFRKLGEGNNAERQVK